jgi:flagellar basal body-associated protein FliL
MSDATKSSTPGPTNRLASDDRIREKSPIPLFFVIALLAVAGAAGTTWFVVQRGQTADAAHSSDTSTSPKFVMHLEGFTVNLADPEETHFLRVTMDLGVDRLPEGSTKERPSAGFPVSRVRDAILRVLSEGRADVLLTPEGKTKLKQDLLESLNRNVPELASREIYFTEFLVQR